MIKSLRVHLPLYTCKMTNKNVCLFKGEVVVGNIVISGDGEAGDCDIYDSESDDGERKFHLEVTQGMTSGTGASEEKLFSKGIFVKVSGGGVFVTVSYRIKDHREDEVVKELK